MQSKIVNQSERKKLFRGLFSKFAHIFLKNGENELSYAYISVHARCR